LSRQGVHAHKQIFEGRYGTTPQTSTMNNDEYEDSDFVIYILNGRRINAWSVAGRRENGESSETGLENSGEWRVEM
jgi:hypothetical protein